jgi:hypothetical protein
MASAKKAWNFRIESQQFVVSSLQLKKKSTRQNCAAILKVEGGRWKAAAPKQKKQSRKQKAENRN